MPKVTEEQKSQVQRWINEWARKLKLDRYHIAVKFHKRRNPTTSPEEIVFADTTSAYAGLEADINIWLPFWSLPEQQRERVCVHELLHVLLPSATEEEACTATEVIWCLVKGESITCGDSTLYTP